jgi:hypothetical protein
MKRFIKLASFVMIFISVGTLSAYACHEGDFTALSKGHYKWGKGAGILQYTENFTISSSTSTSCDMYTAYLWQQYDVIQEQVAQGHGEHLDAIAKFSGCQEPVTEVFKTELGQNYKTLFRVEGDPLALRNEISQVIQNNSQLRVACRSPEIVAS